MRSVNKKSTRLRTAIVTVMAGALFPCPGGAGEAEGSVVPPGQRSPSDPRETIESVIDDQLYSVDAVPPEYG